MNKLNFLKPDKNNLYVYPRIGGTRNDDQFPRSQSNRQKVAIDFYGMTISDEGDTELGLDYGLLAGLGVPLGPVNLNLFYVQGMADHDGITFNGMGANLGYSF